MYLNLAMFILYPVRNLDWIGWCIGRHLYVSVDLLFITLLHSVNIVSSFARWLFKWAMMFFIFTLWFNLSSSFLGLSMKSAEGKPDFWAEVSILILNFRPPTHYLILSLSPHFWCQNKPQLSLCRTITWTPLLPQSLFNQELLPPSPFYAYTILAISKLLKFFTQRM